MRFKIDENLHDDVAAMLVTTGQAGNLIMARRVDLIHLETRRG
jgi:hypothetical protein